MRDPTTLETHPETTTALQELASDPSSRRRFLKMVGGTGAAGALTIFLAACGTAISVSTADAVWLESDAEQAPATNTNAESARTTRQVLFSIPAVLHAFRRSAPLSSGAT